MEPNKLITKNGSYNLLIYDPQGKIVLHQILKCKQLEGFKGKNIKLKSIELEYDEE